METIKLLTESYLFNGDDGVFRAIPFFELEFDEVLIYEDGVAKYYFHHSRVNDPFVKTFHGRLKKGESSEEIIVSLGKSVNRHWTSYNELPSEIEGSWQVEEVELFIIRDLKNIQD